MRAVVCPRESGGRAGRNLSFCSTLPRPALHSAPLHARSDCEPGRVDAGSAARARVVADRAAPPGPPSAPRPAARWPPSPWPAHAHEDDRTPQSRARTPGGSRRWLPRRPGRRRRASAARRRPRRRPPPVPVPAPPSTEQAAATVGASPVSSGDGGVGGRSRRDAAAVCPRPRRGGRATSRGDEARRRRRPPRRSGQHPLRGPSHRRPTRTPHRLRPLRVGARRAARVDSRRRRAAG